MHQANDHLSWKAPPRKLHDQPCWALPTGQEDRDKKEPMLPSKHNAQTMADPPCVWKKIICPTTNVCGKFLVCSTTQRVLYHLWVWHGKLPLNFCEASCY